jgi:iron complex outermembrane receptor protein
VLAASLMAVPLTALAQEPTIPMPEVVVPGLLEQGYVVRQATTATKTDSPLIETPQSVSVITRDRLNDQAVNTLAEALRYSAGVQGEPFGFDPRFTTIQIRGFDASDTGLYRDGLQIRNPAFAVSFSLEPWGVERIEILKGRASIMYGAGSPGGLVNLVSKLPTKETFGVVELQPGSFDR